MARARLIDVAREAGVTIGTASKALSGKDRIPESTRQRVRDAADRLGYVPNPVAQALTTGRLPLIGLVVSAFRRPGEFEDSRAFWYALIGAAAVAAADRGYGLTLIPELGEATFASLPYAGLAVFDPADGDPDLARALDSGIPVLTDTACDDPRLAVHAGIAWDEAVRLALEHLVKQGSRTPALLWPDVETDYSRRLRDAHRAWCAEHGLRDLAADADLEDVGPHPAVEWLLDQGADGIFSCVTADHLVGRAAERRGRTLGKDLLLIELDTTGFETAYRNDISAVTIDIPATTEALTEAFVEVIEGRMKRPIEIGSTFTLHARSSSAGTR